MFKSNTNGLTYFYLHLNLFSIKETIKKLSFGIFFSLNCDLPQFVIFVQNFINFESNERPKDADRLKDLNNI